MRKVRRFYWQARIAWTALREMWGPNLGDYVVHEKRVWRLTQGANAPTWTLRDPSDLSVETLALENEFSKVLSVENYARSFRSIRSFYVDYWLSAMLRGWRAPAGCPIGRRHRLKALRAATLNRP